ncbi:MAG: pitrilysin family protein [Vicinamibacterales bacterium]
MIQQPLARGLSPVRAALENGLVAIAQESDAAPAVSINLTVYAGSVREPENLCGLAFLTGQTLDRGTSSRSSTEIAGELDDRGVSVRASVTRHTLTLSSTCLSQDFPAVLSLLADMVQHPSFPVEEVENRRAEAITTVSQDADSTAVRSIEGLMELLYGVNHPYACPWRGTVSSLRRIGRQDILAFHGKHVVPSAVRLAVVGDVDAGLVMDLARCEFADWRAARAGYDLVPPPPVAMRRATVIDMPGKSQSDIAYGFTAIRRLDPRFPAYWMMNNVLGQFGLGGRLADNIRERQGMAYYAFSTFEGTIGEGPLLVRAGVDPLNVQRAVEAIDSEVRKLHDEGPTVDEVEETRESLIGSIPRMFETNESIAEFLQTSEQFGLGLDYDRQLPLLLEQVTFDQVRDAARELLDVDRAAVAVAGPDRNQSQPYR